MKQTAVEYLIDQLDFELELYNSQWVKLEQTFEKAKEMEKQQIIEAYNNAEDKCEYLLEEHRWNRYYETSKQYYETEFKNK